jgi:hypothetical protein
LKGPAKFIRPLRGLLLESIVCGSFATNFGIRV